MEYATRGKSSSSSRRASSLSTGCVEDLSLHFRSDLQAQVGVRLIPWDSNDQLNPTNRTSEHPIGCHQRSYDARGRGQARSYARSSLQRVEQLADTMSPVPAFSDRR